jgi:cytoskeletal protein RodZ
VSDEFEQIGGRLKAAREAAGLTVDDVQFRTQLPRSVVEALEADNFSAFASPVYAKSFLGQYSSFLNVDAQLWLDALEPGGFMPGGLLQPIVKLPEVQAIAKPVSKEVRGGFLPIAALLVLSGAMIYFAIKGYDSFEARFGSEPRPQVERPPSPAAYVSAPKPIEKKPAIVKEEEDLGKPPPRAIIVR